jgi:peptidoglycan/LPS O-acetylase OafA/YrhL
MTDQTRFSELDGLRGIAALVVVIYHFFYRYDGLYGHDFDVPSVFWYGYYGVHLFFIVSGFVIFWSIYRSSSPLDFIWSRFSRLYPPFWFAVTLSFIVVSLFSLPGREVDFSSFMLNLLMFHEYFKIPHVDGVYWTLTLELAFYFWVLIIFCSSQIRRIEQVLTCWLLISIFLTLFEPDFLRNSVIKKLLIVNYIEMFAAGICFYRYKSEQHSISTHLVMLLAVLSIFLSYSIATSVALCGFYSLFLVIIRGKLSILSNPIFTYFGSISYSLYLLHQNIGYVVMNKLYEWGLHWAIVISVAFLFSIFLAHIALVYIEKPSLRKLRSFYNNNNKLQAIRKVWVIRA